MKPLKMDQLKIGMMLRIHPDRQTPHENHKLVKVTKMDAGYVRVTGSEFNNGVELGVWPYHLYLAHRKPTIIIEEE